MCDLSNDGTSYNDIIRIKCDNLSWRDGVHGFIEFDLDAILRCGHGAWDGGGTVSNLGVATRGDLWNVPDGLVGFESYAVEFAGIGRDFDIFGADGFDESAFLGHEIAETVTLSDGIEVDSLMGFDQFALHRKESVLDLVVKNGL